MSRAKYNRSAEIELSLGTTWHTSLARRCAARARVLVVSQFESIAIFYRVINVKQTSNSVICRNDGMKSGTLIETQSLTMKCPSRMLKTTPLTTVQADKKKACVEMTNSNWECSAT
jgi:hypothetical protein